MPAERPRAVRGLPARRLRFGAAVEVAAPPAPKPAPRDEATAAAIELVLAGEHRSAENRARDAYRHPLDTLLFFGIKPDMTVVEVWPGARGWYTEVLAPLLAERGRLYAAHDAAEARQRLCHRQLQEFHRQARRAPGPVRPASKSPRSRPAISRLRRPAAPTWW